ncbi:MAG: hypothetical protein ACO1PM_18535 [Acidovorax sp.]
MTAAATTVPLPYLQSYPAPLQQQARDLLAQGRLGAVLLRKYPAAHAVRSDKALYDYAQELKARHLRNAGTINKVLFDNKIHVVRHALGLHTTVSRVQGNRLAKGLFTPISGNPKARPLPARHSSLRSLRVQRHTLRHAPRLTRRQGASRPRNWCEQALSTRSALRRCSSRGPTSSCA